MSPFEPSYTVMHVQGRPADVIDAIAHLVTIPGSTAEQIADDLGREIKEHGGWSTIPVSELASRAIAPKLAGLLGRPIVTVTVDAEQFGLSVVRPDGRPAGHAQEIAAALGHGQAAALDQIMTNTAILPTQRHVQAAELLGIGLSPPERVPGIVLAVAPATVVRNQLAGAGRGAWIVPRDNRFSLIVSDGSGWDQDLATVLRGDNRFADALGAPLLGITWGSPPQLWARAERGGAGGGSTVLLQQNDASGSADEIMKALGRTGSEIEEAKRILGPGTQPNNRAIDLLKLIGVGKVPVGAGAVELAAWASERTDAVRVREHGRNVSLSYDDPELLRKGFRRRRLLRRVRTGFGWLEFAAWLGLFTLLIWGPRSYWWVPVAAIAGLIFVRVVLKRLIRALSSGSGSGSSGLPGVSAS